MSYLKIKFRILILGLVFILFGCANQAKLERESDKAQKEVRAAMKKQMDKIKEEKNFHVINGRYIDDTLVTIPSEWKKKDIIINAKDQKLEKVVRRMTLETSIKNIFSHELGEKRVTINYKGNLYNALHFLARENNISLIFERKDDYPILTWSEFETKVFQIAFVPGNIDFTMANYSTTDDLGSDLSEDDSSSSSSDSESGVSFSGKMSIWEDLANSVKNILSAQGKMTVNQGSSSITVTDYPLFLNRVKNYIDEYNEMLSKRVLIEVKILEVRLDNNHASGINWDALYNSVEIDLGISGNFGTAAVEKVAGATSGAFKMNPKRDSFTRTIVTTDGTTINENTNIIIKALDTQGETTIVNQPTIMSLNNQPNTLRIGEDISYIKETDILYSGDNNDDTTVSFDPGIIQTGTQLTIIPHIQDDKIYLSLNIDISTLKEMGSESAGSGGNETYIQLPAIQTRSFNQRIMVPNNDLIILGGFIIKENKVEQEENFALEALGGNYGLSSNTELVVMIKPRII